MNCRFLKNYSVKLFITYNVCIKYAWVKVPEMFNLKDYCFPRNFRFLREWTCPEWMQLGCVI